jgi:AraC-like DNA-binding protein
MQMRRETIKMPAGQSFRVIRWSHSVSAVQIQLADGRQQALEGEGSHWHYHPEMELTLFTDGQGTRFVGDHIGRFESGDLVLLGGMLPHHWHASGQTAGLCLQWLFPPHHPLWSLPECWVLDKLFRCAVRGLRLTGPTRDMVAEGMQGLTQTGGLARFGRLLELLAKLAEAPPGEAIAISSDSFMLPADATYQEAISQVMRHLVANFRDEIHLDEVLKIARMSRPTFARQFKRHTGRSLSDFLIELRLQASCHELADTSRSVLEIALACGFSHVSFFNRVFRRTMGCSPSEYRIRRRTPGDIQI